MSCDHYYDEMEHHLLNWALHACHAEVRQLPDEGGLSVAFDYEHPPLLRCGVAGEHDYE